MFLRNPVMEGTRFEVGDILVIFVIVAVILDNAVFV